MFTGCLLDVCGFLNMIVCCLRSNPYRTLFFSTVIHIVSGDFDEFYFKKFKRNTRHLIIVKKFIKFLN